MLAETEDAREGMCKIDWYAFTVGTRGAFDGAGSDVLQAVSKALLPVLGSASEPIAIGHRWKVEERHGFYQWVATDAESKFRVSWGNINANIYCECSGQTCDDFRRRGIFDNLVNETANRASRVDLAVDFETDVRPSDFVGKGHCSTFKGTGRINSAQGETCYVGSRKSDRFVRVYRYDGEHPRSHLLRCEAEYKGLAARQIAAIYAAEGLLRAVMLAHSVFEWQHPLWVDARLTASRLRSSATDKAGRGELQWLAAAVEPALAKYHSAGLIDLRTWCLKLLADNDLTLD